MKVQGRICRGLVAALLLLAFQGCVVVPTEKDHKVAQHCEISSDRKTLRIVDLAKETNSYYSIESWLLSPILIPTTALVSGTYVVANNVYWLGKEKIVCGSKSTSA